jgi:hypothetical protein
MPSIPVLLACSSINGRYLLLPEKSPLKGDKIVKMVSLSQTPGLDHPVAPCAISPAPTYQGQALDGRCLPKLQYPQFFEISPKP